jgi:hypothetical protein
MKRYNGFWNRYNDGYTGTGMGGGRVHGRRAAGKRVRVQRVFSKKNWPALLKPVPVYTRARIWIPRVPGTDTDCTRRILANLYAEPTRYTIKLVYIA